MIDFQILEQFVTFSRSETLYETARQLHVSQSTLTRGMQKLEAEFGVPLFTRTKNSISRTEAGRLAASEAELLLRQYENMLHRVREFDRKSRTISIGACAPIPVSPLVQRVTEVYPHIAISSELKKVPQLLEGLKNDAYQFIILPYRPEDDDLLANRLCEENLFLYLRKQHHFAKRKSVNIEEMNGENMLLFQDIGFWHDLVLEKMPNSKFLMQTESYTFQELILNSTMPVFTSDAFPEDLPGVNRVRVAISDPEFHVTYYAVCKKENRNRFRDLFPPTNGG